MTDFQARVLMELADRGPIHTVVPVDELPPGTRIALTDMVAEGWIWRDMSGLVSLEKKGQEALERYMAEQAAEAEAFALPEKHPVLAWLAGEVSIERWQLILTSLVGGMIGGALVYLLSIL